MNNDKKNIIFCEISGVLTYRYEDANDVLHIRDFEFLPKSIKRLNMLKEQTNSLLVVVKLERWATTNEYNDSRVSFLEKYYDVNPDGFMDITYEYQNKRHIEVYDEALTPIMNEWIKMNNIYCDKIVYIRQGWGSEGLSECKNGVFNLSLSKSTGITKKNATTIKHYLLSIK